LNRKNYGSNCGSLPTEVTLLQPRREETLAWFFLICGDRSNGYVKALHWSIQNEDWGLLRLFGERDVRQIRTQTYQEYIADLAKRRPDMTASTRNTPMTTLRNVLKIARDEGLIDAVPETPRSRVKDNPRPSFKLHPLVAKDNDNYQKLLRQVKQMAKNCEALGSEG
jgi:hypothetical protein